MKLEAGKYYKGEDGKKYGPMRLYRGRTEQFEIAGDDRYLFSERGVCFYTGPCDDGVDLIAQWPAEVGTLAEIGAQVGDVVECVDSTGAADDLTVGSTYDVWSNGLIKDNDGDFFEWTKPQFRIVRRAYPCNSHTGERMEAGPVVTETVTTKLIVPGVYGAVSVSEVMEDGVCIGFDRSYLDTPNLKYGTLNRKFTATELRAAIATLTEIAEAME